MLSTRDRFGVDVRPWGEVTIYEHTPVWWVKKIVVNPGSRTSLQTHKRRAELWFVVEGLIEATIMRAGKIVVKKMKVGDSVLVETGTLHRIGSKKGGVLIEVANGEPRENDIVRLQDDYGRAS